MKLVIGLGNPGEKYLKTRHNLGFMMVDELVKKIDDGKLKTEIEGRDWKLDKKLKAEFIKTPDVIFAKPQTFMNNSGMAVKAIVDYYKIPLEDVIVVYDELDLPFGKIKVRQGGSAAGHHGVESIIEYLKDDKFIRVRLGIGNLKTQSAEHKGEHINVDHFVTEEFNSNEKSKVKHMIKESIRALNLLLAKGLAVL